MSIGDQEVGDAGGSVNMSADIVSASTASSHTSRARAFSLSTTALAVGNMPPDVSASHSSTTAVDGPTTKKRKLEDTTTYSAQYEREFREVKGKLLAEVAKRLALMGQLSEKDMTIQDMKKNHMKAMDAEAKKTRQTLEEAKKTVDAHENMIKKIGEEKLETETENVYLQNNIIQLHTTINDLEQDNNKLRQSLMEFKSMQKVAAPNRRHEPGLFPHTNHSSATYEHTEAPRANPTYRHFKSKRVYASGAGKLRPGKYGSNGFWDLGLCFVHFQTNRVCDDHRCEYRHMLLTSSERLYIKRLEPIGPGFVVQSDEMEKFKPSRSD